MMNKIFFTLLIFAFIIPRHVNAQNVNIPDAHFLKTLISLGIDTNHDSIIQMSEATGIRSLNVSSAGISDLSGIEAFTNLDTLDCSSNQLPSLDLSKNIRLVSLYCAINKLTTLDLSKNTSLRDLSCSNNKLTALNTLECAQLVILDCGFNKQTRLDLSGNKNLEILECYSNLLDSLNLSQNKQLVTLYCGNNQIRNLDFSSNTMLKFVDCQFNSLVNINLSQNTALTHLACFSNQLSNLDVVRNVKLGFLDCGQNLYTRLDLSKNDSLLEADCTQNPYLTSICVRDTNVAKANVNFYKDAGVKWSESCNQSTDVVVNQTENWWQLSTNASNNSFNLLMTKSASVDIYNIQGSKIESFKNIQNVQFGLAYLPGLYFVTIIFPQTKNKQVIKIVKN